ncbi:MAG: lytic transglycosylase domain-containing protein [Bacteroidales bacterium]|nr:lytic transglycosylase domain-containing protein [Bacteroidales bacterium]
MRIFNVIAIFVITVFVSYFFVKSTSVTDNDELYENEIKTNYKTFALPIPLELDFAGERVPIDRLDVRESFDRELLVNTYWHSQTFLMFKRANRFFPIIEPVLRINNVPDDFKYLALIESGFANVTSSAGAAGFWQFMKTTAERYGLIVNDAIDERYNLEKATDAACRFIKNSYRTFGSWTLAAAAYNMGENGLKDQIRNQKVSNYYDLYLNQETARYVFRILALKTIFSNPRKYGFYFREKDLYPPVRNNTVLVDTPVTNLIDFAYTQGINYKILKEYNPWLRQRSLPKIDSVVFKIKIPLQEDLLFSNHFLPSDDGFEENNSEN